MEKLMVFCKDADMWEAAGLSREDEDAVVQALWRKVRGRPDVSGLSMAARLVYFPIVTRWEANEGKHEALSKAGKEGNKKRWGDRQAIATDESPNTNTKTNTNATTNTKAFTKPSIDEVRAYCTEKGLNNVNPEDFVDYYESNGWKVGKNPMKDWKRTISRWDRNNLGGSSGGGGKEKLPGLFLENQSRKEEDYVLQ